MFFCRATDPKALYEWYEKHLGIQREGENFAFHAEAQRALIAFSFFPKGDEYFPAAQPVMINFQVDDLDAVLNQLAAAGVPVDPKRESYSYGRFGWFLDPEGNRVELWRPPA